MNFNITEEYQDLNSILTMAIRHKFYIDHLWLVIKGDIYPSLIKQWKAEGIPLTEIVFRTLMYKKELLNPKFGYKWFVLRDEDKIVGFIAISYRVDLSNDKCFLEYMLLDEAYRGKKLSHQLMNSFFDWCKENGKNQIKVQFEINDERLNYLYSQHGFKREFLENGDEKIIGGYVNWYKHL
jgi:GNAT superfamily N-acetyltransferase